MQHIPQGRFVVLDFETTGISPAQGARIIEVSAREVVDGRAGEEFATLVDPGVRVPYEITQITGITTAMLAGAPPSEVAMAGLAAFIGPSPIVAHNAGFDRRFLEYEAGALLGGVPIRALCTLLLARRVYPGLTSYRLGRLVGEFGLASSGALHRASADTFVTALLFDRICADARARCCHPWTDDDVLHKLQRVKIATAHDWLAAWGKPVAAPAKAGAGLRRSGGADILSVAAGPR